ncbi:MAG: PDZ domain-containing protein [Marmoricola sp.]
MPTVLRVGWVPKSLALWVKGLGQYGKHAAAKKAGFRKEDVIISIDQRTQRMTESELIGQLLRQHKAGESIPVTVRRGGQDVLLTVPVAMRSHQEPTASQLNSTA